jgi:ketosteroid isomerase-like protein
MGSASNKAQLEHAFRQTGKGNGQPFLDLLADDATWTIIGSTPWSGAYRGKQAILTSLLGPLRARLESPMRTHAQRMIAEGDLVAVEGRGENRTRRASPTKTSIAGFSSFAGAWRRIFGNTPTRSFSDTYSVRRQAHLTSLKPLFLRALAAGHCRFRRILV